MKINRGVFALAAAAGLAVGVTGGIATAAILPPPHFPSVPPVIPGTRDLVDFTHAVQLAEKNWVCLPLLSGPSAGMYLCIPPVGIQPN